MRVLCVHTFGGKDRKSAWGKEFYIYCSICLEEILFLLVEFIRDEKKISHFILIPPVLIDLRVVLALYLTPDHSADLHMATTYGPSSSSHYHPIFQSKQTLL